MLWLFTIYYTCKQYYSKLVNYRYSKTIDSIVAKKINTIGSIDTIDILLFKNNNTIESIDSIALILYL